MSVCDEAIQVEVPIVRRGPTTRSGTRALRKGFTKAVQQILDQDRQTDQEQLLIEEMVQLKIQDRAGPTEREQPDLIKLQNHRACGDSSLPFHPSICLESDTHPASQIPYLSTSISCSC
ncbi:hypothetical protein DY000_02017671 [Brassica cretica]|uniref:Uncharacterized protein n=1 Tax=Brassica cretica TaxID=69181 RepID=A0ABQ7CVF9_BRACR|nr:hypothetical protein DY000_02017671 [Brassica cretica]